MSTRYSIVCCSSLSAGVCRSRFAGRSRRRRLHASTSPRCSRSTASAATTRRDTKGKLVARYAMHNLLARRRARAPSSTPGQSPRKPADSGAHRQSQAGDAAGRREQPTADEIALVGGLDRRRGAKARSAAAGSDAMLVTPQDRAARRRVAIRSTPWPCRRTANCWRSLAMARVEVYSRRRANARAQELPATRPRQRASFSADGADARGRGRRAGAVRRGRDCGTSPTARSFARFTGHRDSLYAAVLSPDGKLLATSSYDQHIKLWDVGTARTELRTLAGHNDAVYDLAFRPRQDAGQRQRRPHGQAVERGDGERLDTLAQSLKELYAVAFAPTAKRRRPAASTTASARGAYPRTARKARTSSSPPSSHTRRPSCESQRRRRPILDFHRRRLAVKVWDATTLTLRKSLGRQSEWSTGFAIQPDNKSIFVGCLDGSLKRSRRPQPRDNAFVKIGPLAESLEPKPIEHASGRDGESNRNGAQ